MDNQTIQTRLQELESKLESLQTENATLKDHILRLAICKVTNPKYPYYDWLVESQISFEQKLHLESVLMILNTRLDGDIPAYMKQKEFPNISPDLLYKNTPPTYQEAEEFIMKVLGFSSNKVPYRILKAMQEQGIFEQLCEYLRQQVDEEDFREGL